MSLHVSTQFSGIHPILSPNGLLIASISSGNRLTIRSTETLEVAQIFQCVDKIEKIEISPDSCYVMCALLSRNVIQVFSIEDKDWKCRINEGVAGVINAYWTPDSRNIVTESDFGIQLSLWSLTDSNSVIVSLPKPPSTPFSKTTAFSDCGRFLAVIHRIEHQDQIGVYTVASQSSLGMSEVSKFRARSNDVAAVYWVPGGTHIITLDSPLSYKFCAYTPMGECLAQYEAYQNALGIRCLGIAKPSPLSIPTSTSTTTATQSESSVDGSKFLAVGSFDGKVRLISVHSWQVAFALPLVHPRDLEAGFNGQKLLLTVECMVGHHPTALDKMEEEDAHMGEGEDRGEGSMSLMAQHQVPHAQQQLPCRELRPIRRSHTLPDDSNELHPDNPKKDDETELESSNLQHTSGMHDSYFALKSAKTLPRTQPFILETKRAHSGAGATLGKSTKRPTSGAPSTHSVHGTGSSSVGGFPQMGVSWVGWSRSSKLLAAREEAHSRCLWVWRPLQAQLVAVLVLLEPILCARWRPAPQHTPATSTQLPTPASTAEINNVLPPAPPGCTMDTEEGDVLAFCTGSNRIYFWTAASGVTYTDIYEPSSHATQQYRHSSSTNSKDDTHQFNILSLRWAKDGMSLLLRGKEVHSMCTVNIPHVVNKSHSTEG